MCARDMWHIISISQCVLDLSTFPIQIKLRRPDQPNSFKWQLECNTIEYEELWNERIERKRDNEWFSKKFEKIGRN